MAANLSHPDQFLRRHNGPDDAEVAKMLAALKVASLDALVDETVPESIRLRKPLSLPAARSEHEVLADLGVIASKNQVFKTFIGAGYSDTDSPHVIVRNILQNPGWYTAYTPYQAEIAQGRLEALFNFQTMVSDLTGLDVANASLLDEATAAAEAMSMLFHVTGEERKSFLVSEDCHPQTIAVVRTRATPLNIDVVVTNPEKADLASGKFFAVLLQYPATDGRVSDERAFIKKAQDAGTKVVLATDLLALTVLTPPGELGADVAVGSSQRFGVPLGFGGPHAGFFATRTQFARSMPGRIIGLSQDAQGNPALRMALQTREQHIRREKATSNICTAQVLLAVIAGMYAVYHGPKGLKAIADRTHLLTSALANGLEKLGYKRRHAHFFDTLRIDVAGKESDEIFKAAAAKKMNLRRFEDGSLGIALDETTGPKEVADLLACFARGKGGPDVAALDQDVAYPAALVRSTGYLTHPVFNMHHSETELLRYMRHLESKDFSLTHGMIPLGSCTMKLNATAEMIPVTWPEFGKLHPFAPAEQTAGYLQMFQELETWLSEITGFAAVSLQPNAGSQGEYAGLLTIRAYQESRGQGHRNICLIPSSAHGTNPATAVMAGYQVVVVRCDENGNIDVADLEKRADEHKDAVAALMVTYPSTHGVFEEEIQRICKIVHDRGGQVYMDGANMNAQVGLCRPGDIGADVCHLNLHKTFCIPHGGGGPGMGPIGVTKHLAPFLPGSPWTKAAGGEKASGAISAAPWGSASILPISWVYIAAMGPEGLTQATKLAILSANYMAERLAPHFPVLYRGKRGRVGHECIVDVRQLKKTAGVEVEDVAKRLMDYGFHAPTVSFPVAGTLMIEPTESESLHEIDRFCDAMISIREEIREIEEGKAPKDNNVLKHAPHTAHVVTADAWDRSYSRQKAAFPTAHTRGAKFWPSVSRINSVLGDRNLVCSCPPTEDYLTPQK